MDKRIASVAVTAIFSAFASLFAQASTGYPGYDFYQVTAYGKRAGRIVSCDLLPAGPTHIELQVIPDAAPEDASVSAVFGPGRVRPGNVLLTVNGKQQEGELRSVVGTIGSETFDVGSDLGSAVSADYTSPNRFSGKIERVTVQLQ